LTCFRAPHELDVATIGALLEQVAAAQSALALAQVARPAPEIEYDLCRRGAAASHSAMAVKIVINAQVYGSL
jgi:hypothetical protein